MRQISERDWKIFRQVRAVALERFCEKVLSDIAKVASDPKRTAHERYLATYKLIHERDRDLGDAFNDCRRSTALEQITVIYRLGVITREELQRFGEETRSLLAVYLGPDVK